MKWNDKKSNNLNRFEKFISSLDDFEIQRQLDRNIEDTERVSDTGWSINFEFKLKNSNNFNNNDHLRLADTLKSIEGRFSLSYYDFELLSKWFPKDQFKWDSQLFSKPSAAKKGVKQTKAEEILIMNY